MKKRLLFVYGTLKKGHRRQDMMQPARYLGTATTVPQFAIYHINGFPAMVPAGRLTVDATKIYGELYEVAEEHLIEIDRYEGVAHKMFNRQEVGLLEVSLCNLPLSNDVMQKVEGRQAEAYIFLQSVEGARNLGSFFALTY